MFAGAHVPQINRQKLCRGLSAGMQGLAVPSTQIRMEGLRASCGPWAEVSRLKGPSGCSEEGTGRSAERQGWLDVSVLT